jgi:hypothetical protein
MPLTRPEVRAALVLLHSAKEAAALCGRREFALPGVVLAHAGVSPAQIAALLRRGWLREADGGYVLTGAGARQARPAPAAPGRGSSRPFWDQSRGELRLGGVVVKRLAAAATAQIAVLEAFQAAGWPKEMEATPEGQKARQPKLREAVRNLNRCRRARRLSFWLRRGRLGWTASPGS